MRSCVSTGNAHCSRTGGPDSSAWVRAGRRRGSSGWGHHDTVCASPPARAPLPRPAPADQVKCRTWPRRQRCTAPFQAAGTLTQEVGVVVGRLAAEESPSGMTRASGHKDSPVQWRSWRREAATGGRDAAFGRRCVDAVDGLLRRLELVVTNRAVSRRIRPLLRLTAEQAARGRRPRSWRAHWKRHLSPQFPAVQGGRPERRIPPFAHCPAVEGGKSSAETLQQPRDGSAPSFTASAGRGRHE